MADDCRILCVSLHDVAPATLPHCRAVLEFLDSMRCGPVALLVVPDFHGLGRIDRDAGFCAFLRSRVQRGDEVVLHGFKHHDTAPPGHTLHDWLVRRVRTDGEGEFARLDVESARLRILRGMAVLRAAGWNPEGFVAPAWLMSPGTRCALETLPLRYCATRDSIVDLRNDRSIAAPSLVTSTRSVWRRALSPLWNNLRLTRNLHAPVLRAALHPMDVRHPAIVATWRRLLGQLAGRTLLTEGQLVATGGGTPASRGATPWSRDTTS